MNEFITFKSITPWGNYLVVITDEDEFVLIEKKITGSIHPGIEAYNFGRLKTERIPPEEKTNGN